MPAKDRNHRLLVLRETRLLDSPPGRAFDRLTRMAAQIVNAPVALVSLVDEQRQFFKSAYGLGEPWAAMRQTPLSHSFCQYVTRDRAPLIVHDARAHPGLETHLAIRELNVVAYAGVPLITHDEAIGAFCVIDNQARVWSEAELAILHDLAASVVSEIELTVARRRDSEISRSEQLYRAIVQNLPSGAVFTIDQDLRYLSADGPALREIMEASLVAHDGLVGRTVNEVASPANRVAMVSMLRLALRGQAQRLEVARGDHVYEMFAEPIYDVSTAQISSALLFCFDVTARRHAQDAIMRERKLVTQFRELVAHDLTARNRAEVLQARALAEKTAMLQEIHHRVKNNLQMISSLLNLQARQLQDPDARAILRDTQSRVRSIALLHEGLYQSDDFGGVDMRAYVHKLVTTLRRAHGEAHVTASFELQIQHVVLPLDAAVPCGLIINELITNSLKHAFRHAPHNPANEITIAIRHVDDDLELAVADNGTGFTEEIDPDNHDTMGLTLIRDLGNQLSGRADFAADRGARCTVRFPAPSPSRGPA